MAEKFKMQCYVDLEYNIAKKADYPYFMLDTWQVKEGTYGYKRSNGLYSWYSVIRDAIYNKQQGNLIDAIKMIGLSAATDTIITLSLFYPPMMPDSKLTMGELFKEIILNCHPGYKYGSSYHKGNFSFINNFSKLINITDNPVGEFIDTINSEKFPCLFANREKQVNVKKGANKYLVSSWFNYVVCSFDAKKKQRSDDYLSMLDFLEVYCGYRHGTEEMPTTIVNYPNVLVYDKGPKITFDKDKLQIS